MANSYTFYPLPENPAQFKGIFYMTYYDDDGNQTATHPYSQAVELETTVENVMMVLTGTASRHGHLAYMPPIDNHNNGLYFVINCRNRHKTVWDQTLWRTYLNSRQARALYSQIDTTNHQHQTLTVEGDFRQVPHAPSAELKVGVRYIRGTGHVVESNVTRTSNQ